MTVMMTVMMLVMMMMMMANDMGSIRSGARDLIDTPSPVPSLRYLLSAFLSPSLYTNIVGRFVCMRDRRGWVKRVDSEAGRTPRSRPPRKGCEARQDENECLSEMSGERETTEGWPGDVEEDHVRSGDERKKKKGRRLARCLGERLGIHKMHPASTIRNPQPATHNPQCTYSPHTPHKAVDKPGVTR